MKFILSILICSQVAGTCLPPYPVPEVYTNGYDCMMAGYEEAIEKMKEIGRDEVNTNHVFIKFGCQPYVLLPPEKGDPV
jgi:hypothetical protein|tara:strand:- start:355 stop:591 length:237 start_codon:yes stop_codon:yes gene_type:complete